MREVDHTDSTNPRWRVRRVEPRPWWRQQFDRRLAQADVVAPDGGRYLVRISRNLPLRGSPIPDPIDGLLPNHVSAAILVAANAWARGRTGWNVEVFRAPTLYRSERSLYKIKSRDGSELIARAFELAEAIRNGEKPWEDDP